MKAISPIVATFLILSAITVAAAQSVPRFACTKLDPETDRDFNEWIRSDVRWIVTTAEVNLFGRLRSTDERLRFIGQFWERRDPDPDTAINEFRETYCARLSKTSRFRSGIPGWKTDRGRIFILWGKPDKIMRGKQVAGSLGRVSFEKWTYTNVEGLGANITVTFLDPAETNEFRFAESDLTWLKQFFADSARGLTTQIGSPSN